MAIGIDDGALALGVGAPQHEHHPFPLLVDSGDRPVGELLPPLALVGGCTGPLDAEYAVEQQNPLVRPGCQAALSRHLQAEVLF